MEANRGLMESLINRDHQLTEAKKQIAKLEEERGELRASFDRMAGLATSLHNDLKEVTLICETLRAVAHVSSHLLERLERLEVSSNLQAVNNGKTRT